ncbi:UpxY family transcription antiterminator [Chitinophaga varians]|uniref:UpxY family transcription antiterminator n=1 Tax=Chitinophaga varians TaxID=2202339 RepID=UPI00165F805D|nr:UpxY family transcription antiterminator [Chitinophaga varians]MBC9914473.1 UpxY family transcription antiterminator [Chitinophaga varians]
MNNLVPGWYLIYTAPKHEKKVCARLADINFQSFLPTTKKLKIWYDRKKYIDEPLFPSYVFVYLSDVQRYYECLEVDGALYYVKNGRQAALVSEKLIHNLRLITDSQNDVEVSDEPYTAGQQLVITNGPLAGLSCEVVELQQKRQLVVRVDLLRRNIYVTVPRESLMTI